MKPRLVTLLPDAVEPEIRPSARVSTVAKLLDETPSQIRRMIAARQLEAHGTGVRGVRVFLDSVAAMQARRAKGGQESPGKGAPAQPKPRSRATQAAHRQAVGHLQALGLMPASGR